MGSIRRLTAIALCLAFAPMVAQAQQYFDPGLLQRAVLSTPEDYQAPGMRLGSFLLSSGLEAAWAHNDNVFYTPDDELSDSVYHLRPYATLNSDWNRHSLNLSGFANVARHDKFGENDYEDWTLAANGRVDVLRNSWFSWDASYNHLREDRRDPAAGAPGSPTEFEYSGYGMGYDHVFNRLKLGGYFHHNQFEYNDNITGDGEFIDNADRNRDTNSYSLRADYQLGPETSVFGSYTWNRIEYDRPVDFEGYARDSDGYAISAGLVWDLTDLLTGDLSAGWSQQSYDDPGLADVKGFGLTAGLRWTPRPSTVVSLRMAASPQETTQPGTSGYFSRLYSVRLQQQIKGGWLFNLRGSFTDNDYENPGVEDQELAQTDVWRAGIGLSYLINRYLYISAGVDYEEQRANLERFEYEANRYFVLLGLEL